MSENIERFYEEIESVKIRSNIIPIANVSEFIYDAAKTKPYSFDIVNMGVIGMEINGILVINGTAPNSLTTMLNFPRIGLYRRNDIITIKGVAGGTLAGYIREDLELTG